MIRFITCLIGWTLLPLAIVKVAWDIAVTWVEFQQK